MGAGTGAGTGGLHTKLKSWSLFSREQSWVKQGAVLRKRERNLESGLARSLWPQLRKTGGQALGEQKMPMEGGACFKGHRKQDLGACLGPGTGAGVGGHGRA